MENIKSFETKETIKSPEAAGEAWLVEKETKVKEIVERYKSNEKWNFGTMMEDAGRMVGVAYMTLGGIMQSIPGILNTSPIEGTDAERALGLWFAGLGLTIYLVTTGERVKRWSTAEVRAGWDVEKNEKDERERNKN